MLLTMLSTFLVCAFCLVQVANATGFSVELIHRHSLLNSSVSNSFESPYHRLNNSWQRPVNHANLFASNKLSLSTPMESDYLIKLQIGSPPVEVLALVDMSSAITWTQCKPCTNCPERSGPLFDPRASRTFKQVLCGSSLCQTVTSFCQSDLCAYSSTIGFVESNGVLVVDTVRLVATDGKRISLPSTIFGCATDNVYTVSGIVGLGPGPASLIYRMGGSIGGKFSYCLPPLFSKQSSTLRFGPDHLLSGPAVVSTPLGSGSLPGVYFLRLEAISIANEKFELPTGSTSDPLQGNIAIDFREAPAYLPPVLYDQLEYQVRSMVNLERVEDPTQTLKLCYRTESDIDAPPITLHFTGADVRLSPLNTFVRTAAGVLCFAFSTADATPVLGSLVQINFLIGFDLEQGTVSFRNVDCTKF